MDWREYPSAMLPDCPSCGAEQAGATWHRKLGLVCWPCADTLRTAEDALLMGRKAHKNDICKPYMFELLNRAAHPYTTAVVAAYFEWAAEAWLPVIVKGRSK